MYNISIKKTHISGEKGLPTFLLAVADTSASATTEPSPCTLAA